MKNEQYLNKVVTFTSEFADQFGDFTGLVPKMKARIVYIGEEKDECQYVKFSMKEFEQENIKFEEANWYDNNGNAVLTWHDSGNYPDDNIDAFFIDTTDYGKGIENGWDKYFIIIPDEVEKENKIIKYALTYLKANVETDDDMEGIVSTYGNGNVKDFCKKLEDMIDKL